MLKRYDDSLKDMIKDGILEEVKEKHEPPDHQFHYLPHQVVLRADKPDKIRIVYDGSAFSQGGLSINNCLFRGPVMLPHIAGVLLRARTYAALLTCDIEKAFLQLGIRKEDRDFCRILWTLDPADLSQDERPVIYRFTRVTFGLIFSPFLLAAVVDHHLRLNPSPLTDQILRDIYVDNIHIGYEDDHEIAGIAATIKCLTVPQRMCENSSTRISNQVWNASTGSSQKIVFHIPRKPSSSGINGTSWMMKWRFRFPPGKRRLS
jgi:hypothetical protein